MTIALGAPDSQKALMVQCCPADRHKVEQRAPRSEPPAPTRPRICDGHTIPVAPPIATAEVLIHGLEHGDLDWRTILHPSHA